MSKCPYCDFNSHVSDAIDADVWLEAYQRSIGHYAERLGDRMVSSIYFGGGTPSLMPVSLVDGILTAIRDGWNLTNDVEVTLEANPGSVEVDRFRGYRLAGVDRVSLGVQALNDADLKALGRLHSVEDALRAIDVAQSCFDRVSFDLIYARQNQSLDEWDVELARALQIGTDHMSLYQLTIEDGTAFAKRHAANGLHGLPSEDLSADMYELTQSAMESAGMPAYEISNHARPEAESRHNLLYWRGGDYVGIGPGAHGRLTLDGVRTATETPLLPNAWLSQVEQTQHGESQRDVLDHTDQINEYLMMGLRMRSGIDLLPLKALGWVAPTDVLRAMSDLGVLEISDITLKVTQKGRPISNSILRELLV